MSTPIMTTTSTRTNNNIDIDTLLTRAAERNEDGVYALADGSFETGVEAFQQAIQHMMQVVHMTSTTTERNTIRPHTSNSNSHNGGLSYSRSHMEVPYLQDDRFYLYACTITFDPRRSSNPNSRSHCTTTAPTADEIGFYCATIVFNMALAHHQHGQRLLLPVVQPVGVQAQPVGLQAQQPEQGHQREASLRQALCLYQEAAHALQNLQSQITTATSSSSTTTRQAHAILYDDIVLMQLAVVNNQAHVLYELLEDRNGHACLQQVLVQSLAVLQRIDDTNYSVFEESQIQEFVRNAMVLGVSPPAGGQQDSGTLMMPAAACA